MAGNTPRIPGVRAAGSRPAGSSKYPQAGSVDSLTKGAPGGTHSSEIASGAPITKVRGKITVNSQPA
jgi:hypothetical protein